jgi:predicted secreted Zn-dependent protease
MISSSFELAYLLYRHVAFLRMHGRYLWTTLLFVTLFMSTLIVVVRLQDTAAALPSPSETTTNPQPASSPAAAPAPSVASSSNTAPQTTRSVVATPPSCTPGRAAGLPASISLINTADGLTRVADTPTYYRIYGDTTAQIQAQLQQCTPISHGAERFAGEANYAMTWQYTVAATSNGLCTLDSVKVGLHTNMTLPAWSPSTSATEGIASKWQHFISNLTIHENGHIALDEQHAHQLLTSLQAYPATDCSILSASVQARATAALTALNAASEAYDSHTSHGATQGAILPL